MAAPQLITRDNWNTPTPLLVRSANGRGAAPDGNIYIDLDNDLLQIITLSELATVDLGTGLEPNPLTDVDKAQLLAIYFFLLQEAALDPAVQNYLTAIDAVANRMGKLVGATAFLNGVKLAEGPVDISGVGGALGDDRLKIADSGFTEFAAAGGGNTLIDRVNHGAKSVNPIDAGSQPFFQLAASTSEADRQAAVPVDFSKTGDVNEIIQTFGSTANGDANAGDFDSRTQVLILGVRSFGNTVGSATSVDLGVSELGAYLQGYPLGESAVQEINDLGVTEADVFGGAAIAPYDGLSFTRLAAPSTETGFNEADGDFTDRIINTGGASRVQIRAWLDMLQQQDTDENVNTGTTGAYNPKRHEPFYTIDATGKMVFRQGLFPEGIPAADEQDVILIDDIGGTKTRPFNVGLVVNLSAVWQGATNPWWRVLIVDGAATADFDTSLAVTLDDAAAVALAGDETDIRITPDGADYVLNASLAYDTNTQAGLPAATDKQLVFQCGAADSAKRLTRFFTWERLASITVDGRAEAETN